MLSTLVLSKRKVLSFQLSISSHTILTNGLVIANFSICQLPFIDVDTSVREANYYNKSLLKHNIDNWFNSHIDDIVTLHIID